MVNWGICCCGLISQDFTSAICEYKDSRNKVVAVAARNEEKAKIFADRFKIKYHFDNYEKLALCEEVDIVYVGSIHPEHCKLTKLFLNHGKHVLVEKPMGMTVAETKEMVALAREKKLFLMEGVWSRFFPIYKMIRDTSLSGTIGEVRHVIANFQQHVSADRMWNEDLGGGAILDIGIYAIQFALWVFHDKKLENISGNIKRTKLGVDMCGNIMMEFEDNRTAFVSYHAATNGDTSGQIYGDKGSIVIPDHFWCPDNIILNGIPDHSMETKRNDLNFTYNFDNSWALTHEVNHVADCIEQGLLESPSHSLNDSIQLAEIMENLLKEN